MWVLPHAREQLILRYKDMIEYMNLTKEERDKQPSNLLTHT